MLYSQAIFADPAASVNIAITNIVMGINKQEMGIINWKQRTTKSCLWSAYVLGVNECLTELNNLTHLTA